MPEINVDIAIIGHFAKDKLVFRGEEQLSSGGVVYYGAIALAHLGLRVAVITRLKEEDFPLLEELKDEGILLFAQAAEQTSGIENIYFTEDRDRRVCKPLGFAGPFSIEDLPDIAAKIFLVGPIMPGEVAIPFIKELAARGTVALDAQAFVRSREGESIVLKDWPEQEDGLPYGTFLKPDSAEAEVLTGQRDIRNAARELSADGPQAV